MIKVRLPSAESYKICTRPAVLKSLGQALKYFHLDKQPMKIYFNGEAEVSKLIGGEYNNRRGDDTETDTGFTDKIFVELAIEDSEYNDGLDSGSMESQSTPYMWADKQTGASITPVFNGRKMVVTVNKYFKDRVQATNYRNQIRSRLNARAFNTLFDVQTHYPVLVDILGVFKEVYDRLENSKVLGPKDDTFFHWFRNPERCQVPTDILSNLIGNNDIFVFKQELAENGLNFEHLNTATVNKGNFIGQYEVSWSYSFFWNDHTHWDLTYPIQVYQQTMDYDYLPDIFEETRMPYATRMFSEAKLASLVYMGREDIPLQYTALPRQDNWRPVPESWVSPQLQILVNMEDVPGEQVILNIKEIHGFDWNPEVLKWIMKFHNKLTVRHDNPMQFIVYSDDVPVLSSQLELRANGDLVLLRPPSLGAIYRVTFNFDFALRRYSQDAIDDLVNNPDWAEWIIGVLYPGYEGGPNGSIGIIDDNWDWWDVHNNIDVGDGPEVDYFETGMIGALIIARNDDTDAKPSRTY